MLTASGALVILLDAFTGPERFNLHPLGHVVRRAHPREPHSAPGRPSRGREHGNGPTALAVWTDTRGACLCCSGTVMYAHTFYECFAPAIRMVRTMDWFKLRLLVACIYSGGGVILVWTGLKFETLVSFGSLIGGVLSIGLWAIAMFYTDAKFLPKRYQMHPVMRVLLLVSGIVRSG
ncbi:hypothetical protein HMPREF1531_00283 [Propionibacterium sp. oral taxon 192 str. F0372]|uniref:hypothetical protein n=1 Tax=Propionibacterium sp. oral taxon 192 TaxID=671222 RepID=UPI0003536954|nr:hypothetical protein [Propionibacterium sp. oral taxon 192]EPH07226.1 hypothetical protein HMPREF1531_00283 [Propionibacterium sp. oral taxon 192 str. F0372]